MTRKRKKLTDTNTWDQSRTYALTPMAFLFVETEAVELSKGIYIKSKRQVHSSKKQLWKHVEADI